MSRKLSQKKVVGKLVKDEKGKSQVKMGDASQLVKLIKLQLKKETIAFKLGKRKSMPLATILFSEANKALKKLNKGL